MTETAKAGLVVTAAMTTPSKPGKKPRPVWNVTGNLMPWSSLLYEIGGRKYHGAFAFFKDPTDALEESLQTTSPDTYEDRLKAKADRAEARAERRRDWANKARTRSDAALSSAHAAIEGIPPGQPILVGHHSERRHRAALDRCDRRMHRSIEEDRLAAHHRQRAAGAEVTAARARGDVHPSFAERRVREAEAEIRRIDRLLTRRPDCVTCCGPISEDNTCSDGCSGPARRAAPETVARMAAWETRMRGARDGHVQKRDHWQRILAEVGETTYSRSTVSAGDHVKVRRSGWARVVRANPTTIRVTWDEGPLLGMSVTYLYTEIEAHRKAVEP